MLTSADGSTSAEFVPEVNQEVEDARAPGALAAGLRWRSGELLELFPFVHDVRADVRVGQAALTVTTTVTAPADGPVPVSFGYHPYTRVPGGSYRAAFRIALSRGA